MNLYTIIFWIILVILFINIKDKKIRYRENEEKIKIVLIILLIYYIIYFFLGLEFGYSNSPYSLKKYEIVKNLFYILGIKLMQEFVRNKLINYKKSYFNYIIITLIYVILNIKFKETANGQETLKYICVDIIPTLIESILITFLSVMGGMKLIYSYIIPNNLVKIFSPIFPNLNWYIDLILKFLMFILIFLFINYENMMRIKRKTRREIKSESPLKTIPIIILIIILGFFVIGIFPYRPIAVISNSMYPEFKRGSVLIVKKYNNEEIKINEIIEYELKGVLIVHRVIDIENQVLENLYITKGDNNKTSDLLPVTKEQIKGVVKFRIPYLGYPSVLFSEIFLNR